MGQVERRMYVYSVEAIRLEVPDDESKDLDRIEEDPQKVFDALTGKAIPSRAPNTSKLQIGEQRLAIDIQINELDQVRGRFSAEQSGTSGKIVGYDETTGLAGERAIQPEEGEEIIAVSHFIYLPRSKVIALEWTRGVPHSAAFANYCLQWAIRSDLPIEEFNLSKYPVKSPVERIMSIEFAEKIRLKMPATALSKVKGDNKISNMLIDISKHHDKSGNFEMELSAEKTKSGRHDVFPKADIRDFWQENSDLITRLIVNEKNNEQVFFGENQLIFDITVDEQFGDINATQLLDEAYQRLKSAGLL